MNRPIPKYEEYLFLKSQSKTLAAASFVVFTNKTVTYKRASFGGGFITAATYEWGEIANTEIEKGRYFSQFEAQSSTPVAIIGYEVANALFGGEDPINKTIKVGTANARVIGVQKKAGESIVNIFDTDNSILISYTFASTTVSYTHLTLPTNREV